MNRGQVIARWAASALLAAGAVAASPAAADWLDEAKVGVLAHDVGILGDSVEGGADIDGELNFKPPDFLQVIGSPHQDVGIAVNTGNRTSFVYVDILHWQPTLWRELLSADDSIWVGGQLGGAVHDGDLDHKGDHKKALGTRALYHLGAELGYQIDPVYSVSGYFVHLSNAGASSHNAGINDFGVRVGFKF
jgi:lipid A 3-O-deacylase